MNNLLAELKNQQKKDIDLSKIEEKNKPIFNQADFSSIITQPEPEQEIDSEKIQQLKDEINQLKEFKETLIRINPQAAADIMLRGKTEDELVQMLSDPTISPEVNELIGIKLSQMNEQRELSEVIKWLRDNKTENDKALKTVVDNIDKLPLGTEYRKIIQTYKSKGTTIDPVTTHIVKLNSIGVPRVWDPSGILNNDILFRALFSLLPYEFNNKNEEMRNKNNEKLIEFYRQYQNKKLKFGISKKKRRSYKKRKKRKSRHKKRRSKKKCR